MKRNRRSVKRQQTATYRSNYALPQQQVRLRGYVTAFGIVSVVILLVYGLFFSKIFHIDHIAIKGNQHTATSEVTDQVNHILDEGLLARNILFLNSGSLSKELQKNDYQFTSVTVKKNFLHGITVVVQERAPSLLWQSGNSIYVLSDDGQAIEEVSGQKPNNLPIIHDNANLPVNLGNQVVPQNFINFVRQIMKQIPKQGLSIQSMSVPATTNELYVQVNGGYSIKFDANGAVSEQIADLTAVLKTLKSQNKQPHEYIDLRISGKIFYR